jgi:hypothetical protein
VKENGWGHSLTPRFDVLSMASGIIVIAMFGASRCSEGADARSAVDGMGTWLAVERHLTALGVLTPD